MSFSFGQSSFGTGAKPTGFGTPFGATTTTTSGGFGSTFGGSGTFGTPAFGSTFGTPAATTSTTFGSTFGNPISSTTPGFGGSTFGTPTVSAAPAFGSTFGTSTVNTAPAFAPTFGAPASSAPNLFGTSTAPKSSFFGTPSSTTALFHTPATSTNLFATTSSQSPALFGGTVTSTPGLFGSTTTTPLPLFGSSFGTTTTAAPNLFSSSGSTGLGTSGTGFNLFGPTATTSAPSLFGGFGASTNSSGFTGFGTGGNSFTGFGTTTSAPNLFGGIFGPKPPPIVAQPTADSKFQQILASFYAINVFGDERDDIMKKWNMLQACWGTGKGYYSSTQPPVEYNCTNPFYRFKGIGYVVIPQTDNADGLVKLHFNKKESELSNQKEVLINGINIILGNKPNLTVIVEHIKALADTECEVMISVSEKGVTGTNRKIHANDLAAFLNQPTQKQQLSNVGVTFIGPYMMPSKAQLDEYLRVPPVGIDLQMWQAAQIDNPQPQKYLPTPVNGFTDLKKRVLCEEYETGLHRAFLEKVNKDINELKRKHAASIAQINEQKQKFLQLQHRVLKVLVRQEVTRKVGMALQSEEEIIRGRMEAMHTQLNIPTQFKGQINELLSCVKVMNTLETSSNEQYKMEPKVQEDIKQFLQMEQNGIAHLVNIINNDLKDLKIIQDGMNQLMCK